jgi:predicted ATPase with chaperone activity
MALQAAAENRDGLLVPAANAPEAAVVEGLNVYPIASLAEAVGFLSGQVDIETQSVDRGEALSPRKLWPLPGPVRETAQALRQNAQP